MELPNPVETDSAEPDPQSDLIARFYDGDDQAFEELYRSVRPRVFRLARSFRFNESDAEDIVEEVFVNVFRSRVSTSRFDSAKGRAMPWMLRICANACKTRLRRPRLFESLERDDGQTVLDPPDDQPSASPEAPVLSAEIVSAVADCRSRLTAAEDVAAELVTLEGVVPKLAALAEILDVSIGKASQLRRSTLGKLQDCLRSKGLWPLTRQP